MAQRSAGNTSRHSAGRKQQETSLEWVNMGSRMWRLSRVSRGCRSWPLRQNKTPQPVQRPGQKGKNVNQLDNITVATEAQEPTKPDPACRYSSFCDAERWECDVCGSHSRLIDDNEHVVKAAPTTESEYGLELPDPRDAYIQAIGVTDLRNRAHALLTQLAAKRAAVVGTEQRIRELAQAEDMAEAHLILSEEFGSLKNETARKAWLTLQRVENPGYAIAIAARKRAQQELEGHRVAFEVLSEDLRVALAEMRLVSSQLAFLSGER
jgi:hypothetical protein